MLFLVKNHFWPALVLLVVFIAVGLGAREALGLTWNLEFRPVDLLLGIVAMAASDGGMHGLLTLLRGDAYRQRYRELVEVFRPQGVREIIAGGLLAGGEELLFRGVLLEGLRSQAGVSPLLAIAVTALAFGLLHKLPNPRLSRFTLWADWEGALLGIVYVMSGSLLVVVILHVLHDIAGFSLFALQRRSGWLL
jgi:membrane protease YdiL (CAAX protease family)